METGFDLIVIGNGGLACSIAAQWLRFHPGTKVALCGPRERTGAASAAAGYMLNVFGELEKGTLDSKAGKEKFEISLRAKELWPEWIEYICSKGDGPPLTVNYGTYVVCNARANGIDEENLEAIASALTAYKCPFERVEPKDIKGYKPAEADRALRAVYIPSEGSLEAKKLFQAYDAFFAAHKNVSVIEGSPTQVVPSSSGKIKKVTLSDGTTIQSEKVVIAAGAFTQGFIDQIPELKAKIPRVFFGTGVALHVSINPQIPGFAFELPDKVIRSTNRGNACGIHLVPYDKHRCYVGASNLVTKYYEPVPRMAALHGILDSALRELNTQFYKANSQVILGHRPTSADTFPIIGKTSIDGLWIATGTKREGLHQSPLISRSIVLELSGEKGLIPESFLPERKLIYTMTREEAVNKSVSHAMSGAYQHGLRLPQSGWEPMIEESLRKGIESVYNELGIQKAGIPPELLHLYQYGHIRFESEGV